MALDKKLSIFILGFMVLLIGLYLVPSIAEQQKSVTEISSIDIELLTMASGTGTTANDDLTSFDTMQNASFYIINGNISTDTTVNITDATGVIITSISDGDYNVSYSYYPDNYLKGSAPSRALIRLITIFFVLAVLALAIRFMMINSDGMFKK